MNSTSNAPSSAPNPTPGKKVIPWPDPNFSKNRALVPMSEVMRWVDRHVAWTWDGSRIIAGAETLRALIDELHRLGIDTSTVVFDYIDSPDATYI